MKKTIIIILSLFIVNLISAQDVIEGTSQVKQLFKLNYERGLPPNLFVNLQFNDENGDSILSAEESAELIIDIKNSGAGPAQGLKVKISDSIFDDALSFTKLIQIRTIKPGEAKSITIPIEAAFKIKTKVHKLTIEVLEHFGYDMDPAYLVFQTLEYQSPKMVLTGIEVVDVGEGTNTIVPDGKIQMGEYVQLKLFVQNAGNNIAQNVKYAVYSNDKENVFVNDNKGEIGDLQIGELKSFWVSVSPNKRIDPQKPLPLSLYINVDKNIGGLDNYPLNLTINQKPPKNKVIEVSADFNKLKKEMARFEYKSNKFTTNFGRIENIKRAPTLSNTKRNAIGVVIGVENYNELAPAPYAENDAQIVSEYFRKSMGISKVITFTSSDVKGFFFDDVFNPVYGKLQKEIIKDSTDVYVYYSGHGVPSKDGTNIYLFPSDGKKERIEYQGLELNRFYAYLEKLQAKSVIVFMDACFSGASRHSDKIEKQNLVGMKGVRIKPRISRPWENNPNFSVFSSSAYEETSVAFDESQTGLFTYYFCLGLQGKADLNEDKEITNGELFHYLNKHVPNAAQKISGVQTPGFKGNENHVLIEFK